MDLLYDLHVHTWFSKDGAIDPKKIGKLSLQKGLNGIAVTDHNTIKGALEAKAYNETPSVNIIIGCEIKTEIGDIIGLFLNNEIKSRKSIDVVQEIKEQGGITIIPHPFSHHKKIPSKLFKCIDAIEIENGRISSYLNHKAKDLASQGHFVKVGGSDAHFSREVGRVKTIIKNAKKNDDISIRQAILSGKAEIISKGLSSSGKYYHYISAILKRTRCFRPLCVNLLQWL